MSSDNGGTILAQRFKQALQQTEQSRDPSAVASLFRGGARLTNLGGDHGTDATKFWQIYLDQFSDIRSDFTGEITSDGTAALEWQSRGTLADGRPVEYRGVSAIEFDNDAVTSFRTYYDSAAFVRTKTQYSPD
ncbi:MAG TPA: nuclear transport factor 2 family protein [Chthoniobacterales bacterium]|nr:nuclear transport factor 2 family protein [Chthoniobacterales bacterium]